MPDARQQILQRARAATGWVPASPTPAPAAPPRAAEGVDLVQRFAEAARAVDAEVFVEPSQEAGLARLAGLLDGHQALAWDAERLPACAAGLLTRSAVLHQGAPRAQRLASTLGVTACDWAVADTGSVLLAAAPGQPREASLVVRLHVALVDPARLLPDLSSALAKLEAPGARHAHVNLITGPSRTADIEMTLTKGVHGPQRLVLIVAPWA